MRQNLLKTLALIIGAFAFFLIVHAQTINSIPPIGGGGSNPGGFTGQLQFNNGGSLAGTSSPTVGYFTATSTTATSTFAGPVDVGSSNQYSILSVLGISESSVIGTPVNAPDAFDVTGGQGGGTFLGTLGGSGGGISIQGGLGGGVGLTTVGHVGGTGGAINIGGGTGSSGVSGNANAGDGGTTTISGGMGGQAVDGLSGHGGDVNITGGTALNGGNDGEGDSGAGGRGGNVYVSATNGGSAVALSGGSNGNGGNLILQAGLGGFFSGLTNGLNGIIQMLNGQVFIGTSTASNNDDLTVYGTTTSSCFTTNGTSCITGGGSGTVNSGIFGQLAFYGANGTAVSGTSTIVVGTTTTDANNVGIGTTSPSAPLTVYGASTGVGNNNGLLNLSVNGGGSTDSGIAIGYDTTNNIGWIQARSVGSTNRSLVLQPNAGSKVGIGTTSPYAALSVVGSSGVVADHYVATSSTSSQLPFASTTAITSVTASTTNLIVSENGSIGVGTTSPYAVLSVVAPNSSTAAASYPFVGYSQGTNEAAFITLAASGAQDFFDFGSGRSGDTNARIFYSNVSGRNFEIGNSAITTASYQEQFHISGSTGNTGIGNNNSSPASTLTVAGNCAIGGSFGSVAGPSNGCTIQGSLGVGNIPTPSIPVTALEVNGDITDDNQKSCALVSTNSSGTLGCTTYSSVSNATSTGSLRNQTATVASVNTYTPTASSTYSIQVSANVDAVSANTLTITCTYTNTNGVASTATFFPMGLTSAGLVTTGSPALAPLVITPLINKPVTVVATVTGVGSISYDIDATIQPTGTTVK